jgi:hypothetical protein
VPAGRDVIRRPGRRVVIAVVSGMRLAQLGGRRLKRS